MPLTGVICDDPNHKNERYTFEQCLACSRNRGPRKCSTPYQVIYAMTQNKVERKDAGLSATMLLDCPRRVILQQEEDYEERPSAFWPRLRGTLGHLLVERYGDGIGPAIAEVRFTKEIDIDGVKLTVTGKPDMVLPNHKLIIDYKSNKNVDDEYQPMVKGKAKPEHVEQVNIYRWLMAGGTNMETGEIADIDIDKAEIHYFDLMRWMAPISVPVWPLAQAEAFIKTKARPLVAYKQNATLPPIMKDFWGDRHLFCSFCPVREQCDARETQTTGAS